MKILFIGYSNLLKKRILPVLDKLEIIDSVCIAKFVDQTWDDFNKSTSKPIELFDNYDDAISKSNASIAYITSTNNSHFIWAKKTLNAGMHTIIDKPATIHLKEAEKLINIARKSQLLVSEATVYLYHPQFDLIKKIISHELSSPKLISAHFSFPPLDEKNFRYKRDLGGGAFLDTSPYAVSIGRFFFEEVPEKGYYIENAKLEDGLEISYSLLLKYSHGRSLIGHFGFNTEYVNRLNLLGENICIDVEPIFTIPDSAVNQIKVRSKNQFYEVTSSKGNAFEFYLNAVSKCLIDGVFEKFYDDIYMDAFSRDLIYDSKMKK